MTAFELCSATACGIHRPYQSMTALAGSIPRCGSNRAGTIRLVHAQGGSELSSARGCGGCTVVFETARQGSIP